MMTCGAHLLRSSCSLLASPCRVPTSGRLGQLAGRWSPLVQSALEGVTPAGISAPGQRRAMSLVGTSVDEQQELLLDEMCLLVDEHDNRVGAATKRRCHEWRDHSCPLHRAFSVFLFDSRDRLLLQRRSDVKITFPGTLTNTCCSHPLEVPGEMDGASGVIRAAQRRLGIELGIRPDEVPASAFHYLTRMHYCAPSGDDGMWGEHEIDYILVVRADVRLQPNPNEVKAVDYVSRAELAAFLSRMERARVPLTPWFRLIADTWLTRWWQNLDNLHLFEDHHTIHRL